MEEKEAIEKMKRDFPKVFGMTYEEFVERIRRPEMKILVKVMRDIYN